MKRIYQLVVLLLFVSLSTYAQQHGPRRFVFNTQDPMVHDPVMAKEGNRYYVFYTGMGIDNISSTDLITWKMETPVFKSVAGWIKDALPLFNGHTWAPDIIYYQGNYHLFYACSAFGKNTSLIGHAVRSTLNPEDTIHPWIDKGKVIESFPMKDNWNAIDPNIIVDENGNPWMTFGSFWDGIQLVRLSSDLCKTVGTPFTIARRYDVTPKLSKKPGENAVEAPFIFRHGDYYYLFVSWDYCCRGDKSTYKVAVGRSKQITGPYQDKNGIKMEKGGGSVVIANNDEFNASGHCAAYHFDDKDYFVCHAYSRNEFGESKLIIRKMTWDQDGWPIVSLNRSETK